MLAKIELQNGPIALRKQTTCLQVPSIYSGLTVLFNGLRHLFDRLGSRKELVSKKKGVYLYTQLINEIHQIEGIIQ